MYTPTYENAFKLLLKRAPFYAYMLVRIPKIIDLENKFPYPAAVAISGGRVVLHWNEQWMAKETPEQQAATLEHELLHIAWKHLTRGRGKNRLLWNYATDMAINCHVKGLPDDVIYPHMFNLPDNMTAEWYYEKLLEQAEKNGGKLKIQIEIKNHPWNQPGQNGSGNNQEGEGKDKKQGDSQQQGGGKGDGEGDGAELTDEQIAKIEMEIDILLEDAYAHAKSVGNVPGAIEHLFKMRNKAKTDWSILHRFVGDSITTEREMTLLRPNKRFTDFPGWRMRDDHLDLVVAIDSSGSISDKQLQAFLDNIRKIQDTVEDLTMLIIVCDTMIHNTYWIREGEDLPQDIKIKGRGGTDLRPPFDYVKEHNIRPGCLVYLTDGWGPAPAEPPPYPVLWALTTDGDKPAPWGLELRVKDDGSE